MHELGLTQEIVAIASDHAHGAKVRRLVLEIGKLSAVLPDAVRFCFEMCAAETPLEGAELVILEPAGVARCRACGGEVILERPLGACACGGIELDWISGEQVRIKEMEIA